MAGITSHLRGEMLFTAFKRGFHGKRAKLLSPCKTLEWGNHGDLFVSALQEMRPRFLRNVEEGIVFS